MRSTNKKSTRLLLPVTLAAVCLLTAVTTVSAIADLAGAMPHVGDIIAFPPSENEPAGQDMRLIVYRQDKFGCVLDLNVIRHSGGSLVVETQTSGDAASFRAHWAGQRTSADASNCGSDADLVVDHHDLDMLALSAGGFAVQPRRLPVVPHDVTAFYVQ